MGMEEHLQILRSGLDKWKLWRAANPSTLPDFSGFDLSRQTNTKLVGGDISRGNLQGTDLSYGYMKSANLEGADLTGAFLYNAYLAHSNLRRTDLRKANLGRAHLFKADLTGANLSGARLVGTSLVETNISGADLTGCRIHGSAVWRGNNRHPNKAVESHH